MGFSLLFFCMLTIVSFTSMASTLVSAHIPAGAVSTNLYIDPNFVEVTDKDQLWRFMVGEGSSGVTAGEKYICLQSADHKYLENSHDGGVGNIKAKCGADQRWEPIKRTDTGGGWVLKGYRDERALGCYAGKAVCYPQSSLPRIFYRFYDWDRVKLWISKDQKELVIQGHPQGGFVTTRFNDQSVDCQNYWVGRAEFHGWKQGDEDSWKAKDGEKVILDCDNSISPKAPPLTCSYEKTVGEEITSSVSEMTSSTSSVSIESGYKDYFKATVSTSVSHEWTKESSETFSTAVKTSVSTVVEAGYHIQVVQVVGTIGPFEFHSPKTRQIVIAAPPGVKLANKGWKFDGGRWFLPVT